MPNLFCHPVESHTRRHGPLGYIDYVGYKPWLRDEFCFRCVYCLERERWYPDRAASFSVDHVVPQSEDATRVCDYTNLVYCCTRCNSVRRDLKLIDPTEQAFGKHLRLGPDALFEGLTPEGNDLIDNLRLNKSPALDTRRRFQRILELFTNYSEITIVQELYLDAFGFPDDLPDLLSMRPPAGNSLPDGVNNCFFLQKQKGTLAEVY